MTVNRIAIAVTAAAVLLLLTGCTGNQPASSDTGSSGASAASQAPLTAEKPSGTVSDAPSSPEAEFLAAVYEARAGKVLSAKTQIPNATDAQLLDAGYAACKLLADGQALETITVIDGETPDSAGYFIDSSAISRAAAKTICL